VANFISLRSGLAPFIFLSTTTSIGNKTQNAQVAVAMHSRNGQIEHGYPSASSTARPQSTWPQNEEMMLMMAEKPLDSVFLGIETPERRQPGKAKKLQACAALWRSVDRHQPPTESG